MSEQWKPIPGWEGIYEVSDKGRVKAVARSYTQRPGVRAFRKERILATHPVRSGHHIVSLRQVSRRRVSTGVHRLVLLAFVGPCPAGMEACHNNGIPSDNRIENLRWDTPSANTYDKVRHGSHPHANKTRCPAGHPYDEVNTYKRPDGGRGCRTCRRAAGKRWRESA